MYYHNLYVSKLMENCIGPKGLTDGTHKYVSLVQHVTILCVHFTSLKTHLRTKVRVRVVCEPLQWGGGTI